MLSLKHRLKCSIEFDAAAPHKSSLTRTITSTLRQSKQADQDKPTAKRRKLNEPETGENHEVEAATLLDLELTLYDKAFASSESESPSSDDSYPFKVDLAIKDKRPGRPGSESSAEKSLKLVFKNNDPKSGTEVGLHGNQLDIIVEHLNRAISVQTRRNSISWAETYILAPPSRDSSSLRLHTKIYWKLGPLGSTKLTKSERLIFAQYLLNRHKVSPTASYDFYSSVHVPDETTDISSLEIPTINGTLYPFQKRTVRWALQREGVDVDDSGHIVKTDGTTRDLPLSFHPLVGQDDKPYTFSPLLREIRRDRLSRSAFWTPKGGILAEEMGLGKTLELIALMILHKRDGQIPRQIFDPYSGRHVKATHATLIVTPQSILGQWQSEIAHYAPHLRIYHYKGRKGAKFADEEFVEYLAGHDIVLTTYDTLSKDIYYTMEKPCRNLRARQRFAPPRSPLIDISWWRVCLDEAQMVESGTSNAAKVARSIPRVNAWAVTGTPLKRDVRDLQGLLIFLRYDPYARDDVWNRMLKDYGGVFNQLFGTLTLRHTKPRVAKELQLPPQKRMIISIPFSAMEEENYEKHFKMMCDDCGVDKDGNPKEDDWTPESKSSRMRHWLQRLRQMCLHADLGIQNRTQVTGKTVRTADEVLQSMLINNLQSIFTETREFLQNELQIAHLFLAREKTSDALPLYKRIWEEGEKLTNIQRARLKLLRDHIASIAPKRLHEKNDDDRDDIDESDDGDDDTRNAVKIRLAREKFKSIQTYLRVFLGLAHAGAFFTATTFYVMKSNKDITEPDSAEFHELEKKETEAYDQAKVLRQSMLKDTADAVKGMMRNVHDAKTAGFVSIPRVQIPENPGGLEARRHYSAFKEVAKFLNSQAEQIEQWRLRWADILLEKLLDQDEDNEITGEEWDESKKHQEEQYVYHEALRLALADRQLALTGLENTHIRADWAKALQLAKVGKRDDPTDRGPAPELMMILDTARNEVIGDSRNMIVVKGLSNEIRSSVSSFQFNASSGKDNKANPETFLLEELLRNVNETFNNQTKVLTKLEEETRRLRQLMNNRLEYYRQLQQISDTVAEQKTSSRDVEEREVLVAFAKTRALQQRISDLLRRQKYLTNLVMRPPDDSERRTCIICQDDFDDGVLTVCGHTFCQECLSIWFRQHHTCPMCKRRLRQTDYWQASFVSRQLKGVEELPKLKSRESSGAIQTTIYSEVDKSTLEDIKSVKLTHSFGTKIDTIVRHLLWLRQSEPGVKSVIFSQFPGFLQVLQTALQWAHITFAKMDRRSGATKFLQDGSIECFLLSARTNNAGMNLVKATHVLLCEPLLNVAIELQAVARVHRIGQHRLTTVWMFVAQGTVEENIHEVSLRRRLDHIRQNSESTDNDLGVKVTDDMALEADNGEEVASDETALEAANSLELQASVMSKLLTSDPNHGEFVQDDDLWRCLFRSQPQQALSKRDKNQAGLSDTASSAQLARLAIDDTSRALRAEAAQTRAEQSQGALEAEDQPADLDADANLYASIESAAGIDRNISESLTL